MANPYNPTDPTLTDPSSRTSHSTVRVSGSRDEDRIDYQQELDRLRSDLGKLAETVGGTVRNKVEPMTRELEAAVTRNPTASVAIAAGVGLLLGLIMSRR